MKKIIVVDDERSILDALDFMLSSEGYHVRTASHGNELLRLTIDKPDLIILDLLISGEDGRQICRMLKTREDTKDIPVIMISAHPNAKQFIKDCGADDFLSKPFDMNEFLNVISRYCNKSPTQLHVI